MESENVVSPRDRALYMAALVQGGLVVVAIVLGWLFDVPAWTAFQPTWRDAAIGVLATGPMIVLLLITEWLPFEPLKNIQRLLDETLLPLFVECTWIDLALVSMLAGIGEELLFRGVVQGALVESFAELPYGPENAIVLASITFGLAHLITPTYAVLVTLVGIYLGVLYHWTDNLFAPAIAHALYDFIALVWLLRAHRKKQADVESSK